MIRPTSVAMACKTSSCMFAPSGCCNASGQTTRGFRSQTRASSRQPSGGRGAQARDLARRVPAVAFQVERPEIGDDLEHVRHAQLRREDARHAGKSGAGTPDDGASRCHHLSLRGDSCVRNKVIARATIVRWVTSKAATARELQASVQAFVRSFGLLVTKQNPCGEPISPSIAHALMGAARASRGGRRHLPASSRRYWGWTAAASRGFARGWTPTAGSSKNPQRRTPGRGCSASPQVADEWAVTFEPRASSASRASSTPFRRPSGNHCGRVSSC
jgi:hypothetical protein